MKDFAAMANIVQVESTGTIYMYRVFILIFYQLIDVICFLYRVFIFIFYQLIDDNLFFRLLRVTQNDWLRVSSFQQGQPKYFTSGVRF